MYKQPICDCGCKLELYYETGIEIITPITTKGIKSKREKQSFPSCDSTWERLRCPQCFNQYQFLFDDLGRMIRGNKWIE